MSAPVSYSQPASTSYVYINYANADEGFALRLYDGLHNLGLNVWIDQRDIGRNEHWHQAVNKALNTCTHMLLVWSKDAEESREVESEWAHFKKLNKPILVILRDRQPLHYSLENTQCVDFTRDYDTALRQLMPNLSAPQRDPQAARVALEQGNAAFRAYDYANAIKAYTRAIALDPGNAVAFHSRGMCYNRLGHQERALDDYAEAIRLDSSLAEAHYHQGLLLLNDVSSEFLP